MDIFVVFCEFIISVTLIIIDLLTDEVNRLPKGLEIL